VHPDLFEGHKEEQRVNTESLKELHKAVERLTDGRSADSVQLNFYYREKDVSNGTFQFASVRLTDSLVPLYEVFGVISPEEAADLRSNEAHDAGNLDDTNFLQWLEATIQVRNPSLIHAYSAPLSTKYQGGVLFVYLWLYSGEA
jgi:hypothetical protein